MERIKEVLKDIKQRIVTLLTPNKEYKVFIFNNPLGFNLVLGRILFLRKDTIVLQQVVRALQIRRLHIKYPLVWVLEYVSKLLQYGLRTNLINRHHTLECEVLAVLFDSKQFKGHFSNFVATNCIINYNGIKIKKINEAVTLGILNNDIAGMYNENN